MLHQKSVAVVVPAFNEATQITWVLQSIPPWVDRIVVVNDASTDDTEQLVKSLPDTLPLTAWKPEEKLVVLDSPYQKANLVQHRLRLKEELYYPEATVTSYEAEGSKLVLISHAKNRGVGAAMASGYKWCRDAGIDCVAVMAGDGQMDPAELEMVCTPVVRGEVDYAKGNRLMHPSAWWIMPRVRFLGNSVLSALTKIASGYWQISDTQCGYTAISLRALEAIRLYKIYPRYGVPNDLLVRLNMAYCTVREIPIKPVYQVGERSKMIIPEVMISISGLLVKSFFKRLYGKYLFRDFHPLFVLYHLSFVLLLALIPYTWWVGVKVVQPHAAVDGQDLLVFAFLFISFFQSLLFAMWMDMQDNQRLIK